MKLVETEFYYLQSRYYDAEIERFLNADSYVSTGQSFLGYNAFAYCGNNPVNRAASAVADVADVIDDARYVAKVVDAVVMKVLKTENCWNGIRLQTK